MSLKDGKMCILYLLHFLTPELVEREEPEVLFPDAVPLFSEANECLNTIISEVQYEKLNETQLVCEQKDGQTSMMVKKNTPVDEAEEETTSRQLIPTPSLPSPSHQAIPSPSQRDLGIWKEDGIGFKPFNEWSCADEGERAQICMDNHLTRLMEEDKVPNLGWWKFKYELSQKKCCEPLVCDNNGIRCIKKCDQKDPRRHLTLSGDLAQCPEEPTLSPTVCYCVKWCLCVGKISLVWTNLVLEYP